MTLWTWRWTLWITGERLRGSSKLISGAWPSGPLVIKPHLSILVEPQTLWEKKLPLSLACRPTQGHYSREIRGYASTPRQRQQLRPAMAFLVTIQLPMLHIASLGGMEIVEGYPWCCCSCFEGTCGPWHLPHPCLSTGMSHPSHHWPDLHPVQTFPIGRGDGCNHIWRLYYTLHKTYVWKCPFCSHEFCLSTSWVDRTITIYRLFLWSDTTFREWAVYCDTSSIVFKMELLFWSF